MRVVIQVVSSAKCIIKDKVYSEIEKGFVLLVSFNIGDNPEKVIKCAQKIKALRVFEDENNKINLNINEANGSILSISQFTLYGDLKKGNRPSFTNVLIKEEAKKLYELFNIELKSLNLNVKTGIFQEDMKISLVNEGPKTFIIDF